MTPFLLLKNIVQTKINITTKEHHVYSYRASIDIQKSTLQKIALWFSEHRKILGTRKRRRKLSTSKQALLVLRWLKHQEHLGLLAQSHKISLSTCYRYLHEALSIISHHAPELDEVLALALSKGEAYLAIDGTLIPTDRVNEKTDKGNDIYYSGKHKSSGVNVQILTNSKAVPLWISPAMPGSSHDMKVIKAHGLAELLNCEIPVLTDKGYVGSGLITPTKGKNLPEEDTIINSLISSLRFPLERVNAYLEGQFKALRKISLCPLRATDIVRSAMVVMSLEREVKA